MTKMTRKLKVDIFIFFERIEGWVLG